MGGGQIGWPVIYYCYRRVVIGLVLASHNRCYAFAANAFYIAFNLLLVAKRINKNSCFVLFLNLTSVRMPKNPARLCS